MADHHEVSFTINPRVFGEALQEVRKDQDLASGTLFIAAADGTDSELFEHYGCAPQILLEGETGQRVILGLQGMGRNYVFADIPARDIESEGMFLVQQVDQLGEWSGEAKNFTDITYSDENGQTLRLDYESGHDEIDVKLFYTGDSFDHLFQAHQDRYNTPISGAKDEDLASMLKLARQLAPTDKSTKRSGDLIFDVRDDGTPYAEFFMRESVGKTVVASRQQTDLDEDYPLANFAWEVNGRDLSMLQRTLKMDTVAATVEDEHERLNDAEIDRGQEPELETRLLQMAYEMSGPGSSRIYVHRQVEVRRENPPINNWTGDDENIFENEHCRLFGAVYADPFLRALRKTWALKRAKVIKGTRIQEDGRDFLELHTRSGKEKADRKLVEATTGDAGIDECIFVPDVRKAMERIVGDNDFAQIRSFPVDEGEVSNAYVLVPVSEDADAPEADVTDPSRYMIVTWNA